MHSLLGRFILIVLSLFIACIAFGNTRHLLAQIAIPQGNATTLDTPPAEQPPTVHENDPDAPETRRFTLYPVKSHTAALKHRLLPKYLDKQPGNAALQYLKAILPENWGSEGFQQTEKLHDFLDQPIEKFDVVAARKLLDRINPSIFRFAKLGAHRRDCEWDLPIREENYLEILLPDTQAMRQIGRYLAFRARVQIAEGKIDEALQTIQVGMALSIDVTRGPTLIHGLVGAAIGGLMTEQLRELVQSPACPNLYWSFAALPRPFVDLRMAMEMESDGIMLMFPQLKDVDKQQLSEEQWNSKLAEFGVGLQRMMPMISTDAPRSIMASVGFTAWTTFKFPQAKADLIAVGWPKKQIEAMPMAQVLLLHISSTFEYLRDESFKWSYIPYWQAVGPLTKAERTLDGESGRREILPLARLLVPAVNVARSATVRLDRKLAALATVEAIRMYAADHDGKLPAALADITAVPVPIDPVTGKSFDYEYKGKVATLIGPVAHGRRGKDYEFRYELTIGKASPRDLDTKVNDAKAKPPTVVADGSQKTEPTNDDAKPTHSAPVAKRPLGGLFRNPITQARESARRSQSTNNLKQFALAMHMYADNNKHFPPAASVDKAGKPLLSWRVHLLPYIEQEALYKQFKLDEAWDSDHNKPLIDKMPKLFENPSSIPLEAGTTSYLVVRGKETVFHDDKGTKFAEIRDGTSKTILIVEAGPKSAVVWTKPEDIEFDEKDPWAGLLGMREGGFIAAFADGSVRFLSESISKEDIKALFTRAGQDQAKMSKEE